MRHRYSTRIAAMLEDKLHVFVTRFTVPLLNDIFQVPNGHFFLLLPLVNSYVL